jgi:hypothetical protein
MTTFTQMTSGHTLASSNISLSLHFGNGTIVTYDDLEGTTVLNVTESVVEVGVEWFGDLVYVESVAGVHEDDGGYWQYWVNDELGPVAANVYQLEDGDVVEWKQSMQTNTTTTIADFDSSVFAVIGVSSVLGIGFLFIMYVRTKR